MNRKAEHQMDRKLEKEPTNTVEEKWKSFIDSMKEDKYQGVKNYFEAIKYISDIDIDKIDNPEIRNEIDEKIGIIEEFINTNKAYYELGNIKGFEVKKITGRDYYYYIADQHIKATVYYARYLNFINNCEIQEKHKKEVIDKLDRYYQVFLNEEGFKNESVEKGCEKIIEAIEGKTIEFEKIIEAIERKTIEFENGNKENINDLLETKRIELIRYMEEWKLANNLDYKIYMMLNNMMREVRFFGAAYQYLWHWNQHKTTLYRSGSLDVVSKEEAQQSLEKKDILKNMFSACVDHMNSPSKPSKKLYSFSENLLLDIYKYLILKQTENNTIVIYNENGLRITCNAITNTASEEFHIIKDASINSIFVEGKIYSFYEYIINSEIPKSDIAYSVEMYPQDLLGERNEKGTVKGMRDKLLPVYFASWGIDVSLSRTKVADDKEVITYGECYTEKVTIDSNSLDFTSSSEGTLFTISLYKEDIIYLLLKIYEKKENAKDDEIVEKIVDSIWTTLIYCESLKGKFTKFYEKSESSWKQTLIYKKENSFKIEINANRDYLDSINKSNSDEKTARETMKKDIEEHVREYLKLRYKGILNSNSVKGNFILSTIGDNEFKFWSVSQYNKYKAEQEDSELAMLKYIIFKEA